MKPFGDNYYTATQIDAKLRLERGCCLEACEHRWISHKERNGVYYVAIEDAIGHWKKRAWPDHKPVTQQS